MPTVAKAGGQEVSSAGAKRKKIVMMSQLRALEDEMWERLDGEEEDEVTC